MYDGFMNRKRMPRQQLFRHFREAGFNNGI